MSESVGVALLPTAPDGVVASLDGARTNWVWLADIAGWERALELGWNVPPPAPSLAEHFATVHWLGLAGSLLARRRAELAAAGLANVSPACASPLALPYRDATFDCVALASGCETPPPPPPQSLNDCGPHDRLLRECRRVLRQGGCLYLGILDASWWRQAAPHRVPPPGPASSPRSGGVRALRPARRALQRHATRVLGLKRRLTRAGFSRVQLHGVEPSAAAPRCIIPLEAPTVLAYERWVRDPSARAPLRRMAARVRLSWALYPALIFLAYA